MLLLWPGWVRRKREDDFGQIWPALFAGTNISDQSIKEISSTSYSKGAIFAKVVSMAHLYHRQSSIHSLPLLPKRSALDCSVCWLPEAAPLWDQ